MTIIEEFILGKKLRHVMLTNMYGGIGGGEICLLHHIRHLHANGTKVTLFLLESGPFEAEAQSAGATVFVDPFSWRGGKLRSALALAGHVLRSWRLISRRKPDLVCCYTFNDFVVVGAAARLAGVPIVWRTQGEIVPENVKAVGANWLGHKLSTFCQAIRPFIASTTEAEASALNEMNLGAKNIECVYLGTPLAEYSPPVERPYVKFGLFGRLVEWKGQHIFLEALGQLRKQGYYFEAIVVGGSAFGDGPAYEARLDEIIARHGLGEQVKMLGFRRDVEDLMRECDVICHCSSVEPFGMVIIEAMMLGRPVVATSVRGPRESVTDGVVGLLIPPNDPFELAKAMQTMIEGRDRRLAMGLAARNRAETTFSLDVCMGRLDSLFDKVLQGSEQ